MSVISGTDKLPLLDAVWKRIKQGLTQKKRRLVENLLFSDEKSINMSLLLPFRQPLLGPFG
ncbi:hypothetical protein FORC53_1542 [Vibrio vulnificus]|uniref:Uncharacterized protein n=1 Tax=Vibrio vulnificus TaxID=672 RepID=A0AAN1PN33_VIBVL|nr:hypothetical protein FORC53_1542 [Vibrio vulnificus]